MAASNPTLEYLNSLAINDAVTVRLTPPMDIVHTDPSVNTYLFGGVTMSGVLNFKAPRRTLAEVEREGSVNGFSAYPADDGGYLTDFGATLVEVIVPDDVTLGEPAEAGAKKYTIKYVTTLELTVEVEARDEDRAEDAAAKAAEGYLNTLRGDGRVVAASATIDGMPSESVVEGFAYTE